MNRIALVFAMLAVAVVAAQQQPTFRSGVALVRIDVVAVDADGHAVRGLTKDNFTVIDHGKPQTVVALDEITHQKPPAPLLPPTLRLDVANNATAQSDRLIILILAPGGYRLQIEATGGKAAAQRVLGFVIR